MTKFITIASGKGGVGKTTTALNLAHAIHELGKRCLLVDANLQTPNVALSFGFMNPPGTLNKLLRKESGLHEIMYHRDNSFSFIPSSPSLHEYLNTKGASFSKLFSQLEDMANVVLLDAPSGIGEDIHQLLKLSDEVIIVINPTLSSVTDALKIITIAHQHDTLISGIVLNMVNRGRHELNSQQISEIVEYPIIATIKTDRKIRKSAYQHQLLLEKYPRSRSAKEFKNIASYLTK